MTLLVNGCVWPLYMLSLRLTNSSIDFKGGEIDYYNTACFYIRLELVVIVTSLNALIALS